MWHSAFVYMRGHLRELYLFLHFYVSSRESNSNSQVCVVTFAEPLLNMLKDIFESISMWVKPNFNFLYLLGLAGMIYNDIIK